MRDQTRIGAVIDHRCRSLVVAPGFEQLAHFHVPIVKRVTGRVVALRILVRIPHFDGGVDVEHLMIAAPLQHGVAFDIPGEVDDHIAGADVFWQQLAIILFGDPIENVVDALFQGVFYPRAIVDEIRDRDIFRRHVDEFEHQRHSALGYRSTADYEQSSVKLHRKSPFNKQDLARGVLTPRLTQRGRSSPLESPFNCLPPQEAKLTRN